jgi:hypothetical protein
VRMATKAGIFLALHSNVTAASEPPSPVTLEWPQAAIGSTHKKSGILAHFRCETVYIGR